MVGPIFLYLIERFIRFYRSFQAVKIIKVRYQPLAWSIKKICVFTALQPVLCLTFLLSLCFATVTNFLSSEK